VTEREFLRVVASIRRIPADDLLDVPLEEAPFDSLDLLMLRSALEVELGRCLTDDRFLARSTLRDLYLLVSAP
jgi:acyl carrier protein